GGLCAPAVGASHAAAAHGTTMSTTPNIGTTPTLILPAPGESERMLGVILRREAGLTAENIEEALEEQRRERRKEGGRLGEILVRLHHATEEQVLHALGTQLGLPLAAELKPEEVDPELVARVPINFAKAHRLVPVRRVLPEEGARLVIRPLVVVAMS